MKKITNLITAVMCLFVATLCACSSGNDDMYQFAGADNAVILSLSPEQIIKNAGFTNGPDGLQAPEGFDRLTGNNENIKTMLRIKGIDPSNLLITADVADNSMSGLLMVARVNDKPEVASFLESQHYTKASEADGYDIYDIKGSALMLGDGLLVMLDKVSVNDCAARLAQIRDNAAARPVKDWQKDVLDGDETFRLVTNTGKLQMVSGGGIDMQQISTKMSEKLYGVPASQLRNTFTATLRGNTLSGRSETCDADGKSLKLKVDCPKIDTSLLKYCHSGDQLLFMSSAVSLVDWREMLSEVLGNAPQATIVANVLADLDGTLMISGGVSDVNAVMSSGNGFQLTIAAQFKDAGKYASQLDMLLKSQITSYGDVKTVRMPGMPEFSYTVKDKTIIFSVGAPLSDEGAGVFKDKGFSDKIGVFDLRVPADNPSVTVTPLPFAPCISASGDTKTTEFELKLDGSDEPLLKQLISFAAKF